MRFCCRPSKKDKIFISFSFGEVGFVLDIEILQVFQLSNYVARKSSATHQGYCITNKISVYLSHYGDGPPYSS